MDGVVDGWDIPVQPTRLNGCGVPCGYLIRHQRIAGSQIAGKAMFSAGAKIGSSSDRVAARAGGSFNIQTSATFVQGIDANCWALLRRAERYTYSLKQRAGAAPWAKATGPRGRFAQQ